MSTEPGRGRRRLSVVLRWALLGLVVAGFVLAVGDRWDEVVQRMSALEPAVLAGCLALAVVGLVGSWWSWAAVLDDFGSRVPRRPSARMFFVGQLGKYVPGSVWPVVVQMRMGRELGVPRTRVALSFAVTLGISVAVGLLVGLLSLPSLLAGTERAYALVLLLVPVGLVALHPRVLNRGLGLLLRLARRDPLEQPLAGSAIVRSCAGALVFWLVGGLHVWLLAVAFGADPLAVLPVALGGFALAFCTGPLLVVLPAGAGVREAVMTVVLATALPVGAAVAVALTSRVLLLVADGLVAAVAALVGRSPRVR